MTKPSIGTLQDLRRAAPGAVEAGAVALDDAGPLQLVEDPNDALARDAQVLGDELVERDLGELLVGVVALPVADPGQCDGGAEGVREVRAAETGPSAAKRGGADHVEAGARVLDGYRRVVADAAVEWALTVRGGHRVHPTVGESSQSGKETLRPRLT
jgi:hypothetical protein